MADLTLVYGGPWCTARVKISAWGQHRRATAAAWIFNRANRYARSQRSFVIGMMKSSNQIKTKGDPAMKLVFTKGKEKFDRMELVRAGQPSELVNCPKQGIIPHDMVHYAVEHTLDARGFLTRVMEGESAAFQMQGEAQSDAVERLVEVFQADAWSGGTSSELDLVDIYRVTCLARSCPGLDIDKAAIIEVRDVIAELTERWKAVPVGGVLELGFASEG
jgi:hypothetical protein